MKKGFTLVELLAVIVILALIALITIPVILNVIEKSKLKTYQRSIDSYGGAVNKAIAEYLLDHEDQTSKILTYEDIKDYIKYEGNKVECTTFEIYKDKTVYLSDCKVNNESINYTYGTHQDILISNSESYIGYYADVDGDGNADGVIYADLAHSKSGNFLHEFNSGFSRERIEYSYEAKDNLKEYIISKKNSEITTFGANKVIKLKSGSIGNSRFYVMALEDFTTGSMIGDKVGKYYWYYNAYDKMSTYETDTSVNFGTGYENTGNMIRIWNKNGIGEGSYEGATQNDYDVWKHIQAKYDQGWYIPSRAEWGAFLEYLEKKEDNPLIYTYSEYGGYTKGNGDYKNIYKLSTVYLSSSHLSTRSIWEINFAGGHVQYNTPNSEGCVRLSTNF